MRESEETSGPIRMVRRCGCPAATTLTLHAVAHGTHCPESCGCRFASPAAGLPLPVSCS